MPFFVEVNNFFITFAFEFGKVKLLAMLIRDLYIMITIER